MDLNWTSDICERAGNVGDVKVTDEGEILDQSRGRTIVFQPLHPDWPALRLLLGCVFIQMPSRTLTLSLESTRRTVP